MHQLEDLISQVLERGTDSASFSGITLEVSKLEPADALVVWLKALSQNSDLILVRLQLAKLLWQLDCVPFALEQLQQIHIKTAATLQSDSLKRLIEKLGGALMQEQSLSQQSDPSNTLASVEFDIEVLESEK